jgi:hypothetical protein
MMIGSPLFSIVVATYNRGRHIIPTIDSVLGQSFGNFELLVVGDGVADDTLEHVTRLDSRVGVISLPWNSGSQSTPNNIGISAANGEYIAYLGHDDLWMPDHLESLHQLFTGGGCDVAVSGCALHGPIGTDRVEVTGVFANPEEGEGCFFPPSSIAHRKSLSVEIGGWRKADQLSLPVDADLLVRMAGAGARFSSTERITVHKFSSAQRYLSYLDHSSEEQSEMLQGIQSGAINGEFCASLVERAKGSALFMPHRLACHESSVPGWVYHHNRGIRGLELSNPVPLTSAARISQTDEDRGLDWYQHETPPNGASFRWSGPFTRPRILIPFTGDQEAVITLHLEDHDPTGLIDGMTVLMNGLPANHQVSRPEDGSHAVEVRFVGRLRGEKASVVQLNLPHSYIPSAVGRGNDSRKLGVMMSGFTIDPMPPSPSGSMELCAQGGDEPLGHRSPDQATAQMVNNQLGSLKSEFVRLENKVAHLSGLMERHEKSAAQLTGRIGHLDGSVARLEAFQEQSGSGREKIDVVYTWVDGSDPSFLEALKKFGDGEPTSSDPFVAGARRFRDNNELRYSLRSLEAYAPWVDRVFLVTNGVLPKWIDTSHPRLQLVSHHEIFPNPEDLPTFSSCAIETHLHRIPTLSRRFLYLNDDYFLGRSTRIEDFTGGLGLQKIRFDWELPRSRTEGDVFSRALAWNRELLREAFGDKTFHFPIHGPILYDREWLAELNNKWAQEFEVNSRARFRHEKMLLINTLYAHTMVQNNRAEAVMSAGDEDYRFIMFWEPLEKTLAALANLKEKRPAFFAINDDWDGPEEIKDRILNEFLEGYFPVPSGFEISR